MPVSQEAFRHRLDECQNSNELMINGIRGAENERGLDTRFPSWLKQMIDMSRKLETFVSEVYRGRSRTSLNYLCPREINTGIRNGR